MTPTRIVLLMLAGLMLGACEQNQAPAPVESTQAPQVEPAAPIADQCQPQAVVDPVTVQLAEGLSSRTLTEGCGERAAPGHTVVVHYTGWLYDETAEKNRGTQFDSSRDRDQRFSFPLGAGRVIKGWDQGVAGMAIGEVRELTIAPEMGYGDRGAGAAIPPGAALVFEIELFSLVGKPR